LLAPTTASCSVPSAALFDAANAVLSARSSTNPHPRRPRQDDYSGPVRCPECGGPAYRCWNGSVTRRPSGRTNTYRCLPCKRAWDAERTDALIGALMSSDTPPELAIVIVPGSDHSAEFERVQDELSQLSRRGLPDEGEDWRRKELRAERDRLRALPVEPARRELRFTGRTRGQVWAAMSHAERVAHLRADEFVLLLTSHNTDVKVERVWLDGEPADVSRVSDRARGVAFDNGSVVWPNDESTY
jgi:hypothetical protein